MNKVQQDSFWSLGSINYIVFFIGLITVFLGYVIMYHGEVYSFQSLNLAPILLFFGYIILIPVSLIIDNNRKKELNRDRSSVG